VLFLEIACISSKLSRLNPDFPTIDSTTTSVICDPHINPLKNHPFQNSIHMKLTLSQKILAGFIVCAIILASVAIFSFRNSEKFIATNQLVNHTREVLDEFNMVLTATVDAETGVRGYVISGNEIFLEPYNASRQDIREHIEKIKTLTADNPAQQHNIQALEQELVKHSKYFENIIAIRKTDAQTATTIVSRGDGKKIQDEIRRIIAHAKEMETSLLAERKASSEKDARNFNIIFILLLVVIAGVLIGVYVIININLRALRKAEMESADKNWLLTGSFELNEKTRGERPTVELSQVIIDQLCNYIGAQVGVIYLAENGALQRTAGYALSATSDLPAVVRPGEGLVGQSAAEKRAIIFSDIPANYIKIQSGTGHMMPRNLAIIPLIQDDEVRGIIEIGTARELSDLHVQFLKMTAENLAIIISAAQSRAKLKELLEETQRQAEELETQQEELKQSNEELLEKTELLERSESELKAQQEELQQNNEELEEKANLLEEQKEKLENAKMDIENKAKELELSGKYKSEFLSNMSHELRTPLNSILILSQLLTDNKNKTLDDKEVEFSKNIYNSGVDLLNLINEILDLSKVESGKIELDIAPLAVAEIPNEMVSMFSEVAKNKSIDFAIVYRENEVSNITTDKERLEQILRNLLSNAFKFTSKKGHVSLTISKAPATTVFKNSKLATVKDIVAFEVTDTGIGIASEKLGIVFEAFQQADGSTKRKYGGTGLGLSISRELAHALGGEIHVQSKEGTGSTFTLYIPFEFDASIMTELERTVEVKQRINTASIPTITRHAKFPMAEGELEDDRDTIRETDKVVLIMEDDTEFLRILLDFVRERGYKGIVAVQGNTGLSYARHYKPDAIILDMKMPVIDGAEVLKHLKLDPQLRHIPVQVISGYDRRKEGMELGAFDFIRKPVDRKDLKNAFDKIEEFVSRKLKRLLVVEDNEVQNNVIRELIGDEDVKSFAAYSGAEAYQMMMNEHFDCIIIDLGLPDMTGFELLEKIKTDDKLNKVPVIVYTGKDLSKEENTRLMKLANTVVLKTADSQERLLDETMLFLHRLESKLPKEKQNIIRMLHKTDEVLKNKKVLVVDDDIRNIYSLTNALEEEGMECLNAENGKIAVALLKEDPGIDIVLMDVMMPEMDGYEATRAIRSISKFNKLPVIALTAKAMKGDREKCLEAGMSDYISKPVNIEQLLSLMRVWLYR
jgi:CheY-like chemotaxis protein/CHASE3 domain sensor protein